MLLRYMRLPLLIISLCCLTLSILAEEIQYSVDWKAANSHYLHIKMTVQADSRTSTVFRIPAWRPGRYIIQNYSRNIIDFSASDGSGKSLAFRKLDKDSWQVDHSTGGKVIIRYRYYASELDAGSSYLDESEVYINPNTCLMYIPGKENLPCRLLINHPASWEMACALNSDPKDGALLAADYHKLVDSPLIAGNQLTSFGFDTHGARIDIVMEGEFDGRQEKIIKDIKSIVDTQTELMGNLPLKRYVFLYHLLPNRFMHGVEHKYSTSIVCGPANFDDPSFYRRFLSITAHEFFHVWNVERIKPATLYTPDYSRENYSSLMWFFEGVTSYYTRMTLYRGGLLDKGQLYRQLQQNMRRSLNNPGSRITSASASSWNSWVNSRDIPPNTGISFYTKGEFLGLLLDLDIRGRTGNKFSLDDVMRYLNREYGLKDRGVPETGILDAIQTVSGHDYGDFFARYIDNTQIPDYTGIMAAAGILVTDQAENLPIPYLGFEIRSFDDEAVIRNIRDGSPAIDAGLMNGDVVLAFDDQRVTPRTYNQQLSRLSPGKRIQVTIFRNDILKQLPLNVGQTPEKLLLLDDVEAPDEMALEIRKGWLKGKTTQQ